MDHTLFLDANGMVYACGNAITGRLGIGDIEHEKWAEQYIHTPQIIPYFMDNKIKIVDIACGDKHTLALDKDGNVYSWGYQYNGACGHGESEERHAYVPEKIERVKDYIVDVIKCGHEHSYCRTVCGKHYLFGSNTDLKSSLNLAGASGWDDGDVMEPFRIDLLLKDEHNIKEIIEVHPGYYNTKLIVQC